MSVPTKVNFWLDSVGAGRLTCQMTVLLQSPKQNQRIQKTAYCCKRYHTQTFNKEKTSYSTCYLRS